MRFRNPNRPRPVAIGPLPLPRSAGSKSPGPCQFVVSLEGGPWNGKEIRTRVGSTVLPFRIAGGLYQPSGKFFAI